MIERCAVTIRPFMAVGDRPAMARHDDVAYALELPIVSSCTVGGSGLDSRLRSYLAARVARLRGISGAIVGIGPLCSRRPGCVAAASGRRLSSDAGDPLAEPGWLEKSCSPESRKLSTRKVNERQPRSSFRRCRPSTSQTVPCLLIALPGGQLRAKDCDLGPASVAA